MKKTIKQKLKQILIIYAVICTILPTLFANVVLADEEFKSKVDYNDKTLSAFLTQERAGNYVASFAINFFNNWSSNNNKFKENEESKEDENHIKTAYEAGHALPNESDSVYYFSKTSWIDFVYENALSLSSVPNTANPLPSSHYSQTDFYYEKINVADLEDNTLKKQEETSESSEETKKKDKTTETLVELMNAGKIKPGDILITSEDDYLLYVGGTKVIYAPVPNGVHPTDTGALKYDYIHNYLAEVKRELTKGHENEEDYEPTYGVVSVHRLTEKALGGEGWKLDDTKVNIFFNGRGYYDPNTKYVGIPKASYEGSTRQGLLSAIFNGLLNLLKMIINLIFYVIRAVIVGWVDMFESLFQSILLKLSGHSSKVTFVDKLWGASATSYAGTRVTVESVLFNKLPLTDANFFNFEQAGGYDLVDAQGNPVSWIYDLRKNLSMGYVYIRNFSIALMLFVLIYTAIRLALSSIAERKAGFSKMLTSWFAGLCIVIFIHFFMYGVIWFNNTLVDVLMKFNVAEASEILGDTTGTSTLYDAVRTKAYEFDFYDGLVGLILYIIMVYLLLKYVFIYLKRMISIYVLALMGSVIGVRYAMEKASGKKATSLLPWMKDYIFNVLIQTIHCLLYVTLVTLAVQSALTSVAGLILAILILQFILKADKLFRYIFNIKGSILDDSSNPTDIKGMFGKIKNGVFTAAVGWQAFKYGKELFGKQGAIRQMVRYANNYREGDSDTQTWERVDMQLLNQDAARANKFYNILAGIPIHSLRERIKGRRASYRAMASANNYRLKRSIYDSIKKEKEIKKKRFTRKLGVAKNLALGSVGMLGSVAALGEGFMPGIAAFVGSARLLRGKPADRRNVKLYRRLNPDKNIARGMIGAAQIADEKAGKDLKKVKEKQEAQIQIAGIEATMYQKIGNVAGFGGMTQKQKRIAIQNALSAANSTSINGSKIRNAVYSYMGTNFGKSKLDSTDVDGVLDVLGKQLRDAGSDVVIDDTMVQRVKDAITAAGGIASGTDPKDFARTMAKAIGQPGVVPVVAGGKVESAVDIVVTDKLMDSIISKYETDAGVTLTADQKNQLKQLVGGIPKLETLSQDEAKDKIMKSIKNSGIVNDTIMESSVSSTVATGIPNIGNGDFDNLMKSIQDVLHARNINVDMTDSIKSAVKDEIIRIQKARIAGDPSKAAEMAELNSGNIIPEASNEQMIKLVYKILSGKNPDGSGKPMVPMSTESDATVQENLQDIATLFQQMKAISEGNNAKNKESAISYGQFIHDIQEIFS